MVNVPTFMDIPIFGSGSSRVEPSPTVYAGGYLPGQAYPAENHNFFLNGLTDNGVTEQESLVSILTEFSNFFAAYSVTPDPLLFNQFLTTFQAQMALKANLASPTFTGTVTIPAVPPPSAAGNPTTKTYVDTALALKANLASPALTGNPTAPTQAAGNASTRLANTAFVDTYFAKKDSPAFTGTPTAPTPIGTDSSTNIATTAFAQGVGANQWGLFDDGDTDFTNALVSFSVNTSVSTMAKGEVRQYKNTAGASRNLTFGSGVYWYIFGDGFGASGRNSDGTPAVIPAGVTVTVIRAR